MPVKDHFGPSFFQVVKAILLAIRHFSLLCVSIQHGIFCFSICYSVSLVLLFVDPVFFIFSGVYFFIDLFLKRYVAVLILVWALLGALLCFFVSRTFFFFSSTFVGALIFLLAVTFFGLYFLFVCTIRRSIFRCAVLIIFSCFCVNVHVPLA